MGCNTHKAFTVPRLTVGVSNDLQTRRNLTGGLWVIYQDHSKTLGPFRRCLYPARETRLERCDGCRVRESESEKDNEEDGDDATTHRCK